MNRCDYALQLSEFPKDSHFGWGGWHPRRPDHSAACPSACGHHPPERMYPGRSCRDAPVFTRCRNACFSRAARSQDSQTQSLFTARRAAPPRPRQVGKLEREPPHLCLRELIHCSQRPTCKLKFLWIAGGPSLCLIGGCHIYLLAQKWY